MIAPKFTVSQGIFPGRSAAFLAEKAEAMRGQRASDATPARHPGHARASRTRPPSHACAPGTRRQGHGCSNGGRSKRRIHPQG